MKLVIVAKTRLRGGAGVGALTFDGQSVRLIDPKQDTTEQFNLEYEIGDVWEVEGEPPARVVPPHTENLVVRSKHRLRRVSLDRVVGFVDKVLPPHSGGPEGLFDGLVQRTSDGLLYVVWRPELADGGIPRRSMTFWRPDQDLLRDEHTRRVRYRCGRAADAAMLPFVGFLEPPPVIPAGTLLSVSLAPWWRPENRSDIEPRCYVQLNGWFLQDRTDTPRGDSEASGSAEIVQQAAVAPPVAALADLAPARALLKSAFGYDEFLPLQSEIIANVLARRDTVAIMPTGGGKSLCYQLPALLFDGLTVVVSPLIALMQDQVDALGELGVPAAFLNSTVDYRTYVETTAAVKDGRVKLLYMAPETLLRPETLLLLDDANVTCLSIDEAHCISSWGHDFRPEYRQLLPVRRRFPHAICLALTATATKRVQEDIKQILGFGASNEFIASFNRPNLYLAVQPRTDGVGQSLAFLGEHRDQAGIIYCHTRKDVETLTEQLKRAGWRALPYHAGLPDAQRRDHQRAFSRDEVQIMVATIAFGMGIDKSNIRFILHTALPENLENYYQQIGRAGRDGLRADCLLLWGQRDLRTIRYFIDEGPESERPGKAARLQAMLRYAQATGCRRGPLLAYFGETAATDCAMCDNCASLHAGAEIEMVDVTEAARLLIQCVQQTGELFGPAHIVDVLRGSRSERSILRWKHDRVAAYGQGRQLSAQQWRELAQQLVAQAILVQDEAHGGLMLGPRAKAVLGGAPVRVPAATGPATQAREAETDFERDLFEDLRTLRAELAKAADVPAFVIFSDRTLQEMARRLPHTPQALLSVPGIGEHKLAQYGERFLTVIRAYCAARSLSERGPAAVVTPQPAPRSEHTRRMEVGRHFASGMSVEELQQLYGVKAATILGHLVDYHRDGNHVDPARLLPYIQASAAEQRSALAKFAELGTETLRPVYDALDGQVSYDDLRLLRIIFLSPQA